VAERALLPAIRAAGGEVALLATGTSCRSQIGDLAARRARHPLELLAERLAGGPADDEGELVPVGKDLPGGAPRDGRDGRDAGR
jgi:hypothetical protein